MGRWMKRSLAAGAVFAVVAVAWSRPAEGASRRNYFAMFPPAISTPGVINTPGFVVGPSPIGVRPLYVPDFRYRNRGGWYSGYGNYYGGWLTVPYGGYYWRPY